MGDADAQHAVLRRDPELVDDLPGIVVSRPDEDALLRELPGDVFGADALDGEGDGRNALGDALRRGDAVDDQPVYRPRPSMSCIASRFS